MSLLPGNGVAEVEGSGGVTASGVIDSGRSDDGTACDIDGGPLQGANRGRTVSGRVVFLPSSPTAFEMQDAAAGVLGNAWQLFFIVCAELR